VSTATLTAAKPLRALGDVIAMFLDAVVTMFTKPFSWRECVQQAWFITRVSLIPTLLVMLGFTLLVIFEVNLLLKDLGALDLAGGIAGIASVQQIGPFVTVVVVAGAGGTAICADLGARTIREEIDAMKVLGINPIQRLVVPRIVAAVGVSLFLNVLISAGGLVGGPPELAVSMIKAFVFGLVAAVIACYMGLNVKGGSKGVGDAVNQAVVITVAVLVPISLTISLIQFAIL
jgi:phospholipid/cholesterol/gamma-HCH transport system permease protein